MSIRLRIWLATMIGAAVMLVGLGGVLAVLMPRLVPSASAAGANLWTAFEASALVVLGILAPIAWLLAGLAYHPVRDVTKTARSILSTGQLDRRCFYPGPHDDVGQLVVVVNELLVRYDLALGALKRLRAAPPGCTCPRPNPGRDPADLVLEAQASPDPASPNRLPRTR